MPVFQVEMRWRCSACQTEILGRYKFCHCCGKPKNDEPFYDAEESPSVADAVTDPALLALATAGSDWVCRFCQNHQSRTQPLCSGCGASQADATQPATGGMGSSPSARPQPAVPSFNRRDFPGASTADFDRSQQRHTHRTLLVGLGLVAVVGLVVLLFRAFGERDLEATVVGRFWEHRVVVERYRVVEREGFAEDRPSSAFDVVPAGSRHHHTERVPDGTRRESYTERVACGQDCRTTSVKCRSNDNGFKTCSGGDRVCSTRYCDKTRYRTVTNYKSVSVSAPYYKWRNWQWAPQREVVEQGQEEPPYWPSDEKVALDRGCGPGERERAQRRARYEVTFEDEDAERHPYEPRGLDEFSALEPGTRKVLRVGGDRTRIVTRR